MRQLSINLLFFVIALSFSSMALSQSWNENKRTNLTGARLVPSIWDMELFSEDQQVTALGQSFGCMTYGAFPTPNYDYLDKGSFKGLSSLSTCYQPYPIEDKQAVFTSFGFASNPYYSDRMEGKESMAFFTLITLSDTLDMETYSTARYQIISRNHPDYIGQGFIKNKESQVDYIAFTTPEGNDYAIVNARIFHLDQGRFIVIAPQKDGSFRSLQLKEEIKTMEEVKDFVEKELLSRKEVSAFLINEGTS